MFDRKGAQIETPGERLTFPCHYRSLQAPPEALARVESLICPYIHNRCD